MDERGSAAMIDELLTVLVCTSPIKSHPDVRIIEKCIDSVRHHFLNAKIVIMADGVRTEQSQYSGRYTEYLMRLATVMPRWQPTVLMPHNQFLHQAEMTRRALESCVDTPLILFMEHDTFFLNGFPIEWDGLADLISSGVANVVNFSFNWEPWVIPEHQHLMLDKERQRACGVSYIRSIQWTQRPHLASADFYRRMLQNYFTKDSRTFIEDRVAPQVTEAWKLVLYTPEGSIRRTWTDDGRAGDPKYEVQF
jgi:hypothetical protein